MQTLLRISDWLAWPCRAFAWIMGWLLLALVGVILYDVIGRKFFDTGSFVLTELEWHLHGAIAMLAFGYAYLHDVHVRIDVLAQNWREESRWRWELVAIFAFLVPFMVAITWFGTDFAWRAFQRDEGAPGGMGLPNRWIIKTVIPLSALLAIAGALSVAARILVALRRPDLLAEPFRA